MSHSGPGPPAETLPGSPGGVLKKGSAENAPARPRKAKAAYHHGDLRRALMEIALVLIGETGAEALNLREAARRLGVSHNAYTRHFADRDALLAAIALDGHVELRQSMDRASKPVTGALEKLKAAGRAYILFALAHPGHYTAMYDHAYPLGKHPELDAVSYASFYAIQALVEECQRNGLMLPGPPLLHTCVCWSAAHGVAKLMITDRMHFDTEAERLAFVDFFIGSIMGDWPRP